MNLTKYRKLASHISEMDALHAKIRKMIGPQPPTKTRKAKANGNGNGEVKAAPRTPSKAQKLHGRYLGSLQGLSAPQRAQVKKLRASEGVREAIKAARTLRATV